MNAPLPCALWTARWVRVMLLAFLTLQWTSIVMAEEPDDDAAIEAKIRALMPQLEDKAAGLDAVAELSALRDSRVLTVFGRIRDNTLYVRDGQYLFVPTFTKDDDGHDVAGVYDLFTTTDEEGAHSSEPLAIVPRDELVSFKREPRVRRAILNGLLVLGLEVTDAKVRELAARDLGNRRQADALAKLREVAAGDPSDRVRRMAQESVCIIVVSGGDATATHADRMDAVTQLGRFKSIRALDMLNEHVAQPGLAKADAAVYAQALARINRHLTTTNWIKNVFFGLSAGSILIILALGLAITFGLMGVINMSHGEMLMIGAVTTWACYEFIGTALPPAWFNWYYVIAFPAAFAAAASVGLLTELLIVRHLYKRPLDSLLATIGVSYILIQAVRLWKGDNLGMRRPSWFTGGWEIMQDVILPYNRLFIIALTAACVLGVVALFRYTRIGLMIRATVQNREMAQSLGVNTRLVDMFTFALGAGLAGIAGYAIYLISNPTPEMGQGYIVKSFLVVVVGGVGKLLGVIVSGLSLGFLEKLIEPLTIMTEPIRIFDATWSQVAVLILVVLFIQRRPAGLFPDKGRMADQADKSNAPMLGKLTWRGDAAMGAAMIALGLGVVPLLYGMGTLSPEYVNKLGYILAFAICAIGLDLVWGYIGVLSLCQFLFFSVGGYCMGLYLINYGPMDGVQQNIPRALFVVMSDVAGATPPWFLAFFKSFVMAVLLGMLLPGLIALVIGLTTFRSRVRGVYFAILTQAITVAFWLVFQKNDLKLGGTNGLTNFTHILGYPIAADASAGPFAQTRFWLYIASFVSLMLVIVTAKLMVNSGFGRVLVAMRDDETRLRFKGYPSWAYKAAAFTIAAMFAGLGGMLYVPQKGIITPRDLAAGASILVVAWVAVGGRGSIWGAVIGAIAVSLFYDYMTSWKPDYWLFMLGGLFILVPLLLPGGIMSVPMVVSGWFRDRRVPGLQCEKCGYTLKGNTTGRCSECGQAIPAYLPPAAEGGAA
jgi:urea ABC transporter permease protein UrtB/urea ABC transporter permease protein UrtC